MKITIGPVSLDMLLKITIGSKSLDILYLIVLWLPAILFIGLCTGIILAFDPVLLLIDQVAPHSWLEPLIGIAWLSLLILYIILGVVFTYFYARFLRSSFISEVLFASRWIAILSGLPFYALCLLGLMATVYCFLFPDLINGLTGFVSVLCFVGFALISGCYLLLLRFFLRRSSPIAHQAKVQ